jgi:hypothetical protein
VDGTGSPHGAAQGEHPMNLKKLVAIASDKKRFEELDDYIGFARELLGFSENQLQAVIVSRNEPHYNFWQFKQDGHYNVTRPINSKLLLTPTECDAAFRSFTTLLGNLRDRKSDTLANRVLLNRTVYTLQQCIGAALDALPAGKSNTARKINGDLFERLIRLVLVRAGVDCTTGVVSIPVEVNGVVEFEMSYQHDLIIKQGEAVKVIGSVKTSSKDRLDKIFVDKFLFNRLTATDVPHIAIFLNDVQRKNTANPREYGVNATFLPGHFKGYTVKLNPLDGVYYCDIRPNMTTEPILRDHIRTFDHLLFGDLWQLLKRGTIVAKIS